ncbi:MAG TPA: DegV family protein [Candidatus Aminicenantes bacterium]|nr:DegV family protein [Candidatus Aminicenantes bacterium]
MKVIGAAQFKLIVRQGMEHLFRDRELLNRINVFPVPDGDTGDNLVHTLRPVYDGMERWQEARLDEAAARLAQAMLLSAKGNSGVIFSQFFHAFARAMKGHETIGPADFSLAMEKAVRDTYAAVADPREGTILTVLRHTAEEFKRLALNGERYPAIFEKVIVKAKEILEKTRDMLPQMKKARVVDAGGLGFFLFFRGMAAAVSGRAAGEAGADAAAPFDQAPQDVDAAEFAFCAEWVLRPRGRGRDFFLGLLKPFGDSLLVAGADDLLHLHIHTDRPRDAEAELERHGEIVSRKVDSLRPPAPRPALAAALIIDSAVDIPEASERSAAVAVVPLQIQLNGEFRRDRRDIAKEELYRRMRAEKDLVVKTSQPAPGDFQAAFAAALAGGRPVLLFSLSSRLSGSLQAAQAALRLLDEPDRTRVRLVDTLNVSAGAGLLLCHAIRQLERGMDPEQVARDVESRRAEVVSLGYVESLEYAVRGGRLPAAAGWLQRRLGVRPLVAFEKGKLVRKGALLSARRKERKVVRRFLRRLDLRRSHALAIVYTDNPQSALRLEDELARSKLRISAMYQAVGAAVLGAHAGPGTFCLFALPDPPGND